MAHDGFVFFRSYYESLKEMDTESQLSAFHALSEYVFYGVVPDGLPPMVAMWFKLVKPTVDSSLKRRAAAKENGKSGGRPPKKENQTKTKQKPKQNLNKDTEKNREINIIGSPLTGEEPYDKYDPYEEYEF